MRIRATANGGKRDLMPCDGSKENVNPGLATNNELKSGSRLAGRNYFRCCFPGKSKPMRGINAI